MKYILSALVFSSLVFIILSSHSEPTIKNNELSRSFIYESSSNTVNTVIDEFDGVKIYDNGGMRSTHGRHLSIDGYNLGLKWQCVEFVKRYYYQVFDHRMPDTYGHAKDFFDSNLRNGRNTSRGLNQYVNGNIRAPEVKSILVFDGNDQNPYGHIGIISSVNKNNIIIAQQNWGKQTRMSLPLRKVNNKYRIDHDDVLGWLSRE